MKTPLLTGFITLLTLLGALLVSAATPTVEIHLHPDRPLVTTTSGEQTILVKVEASGLARPVVDRAPVNLSIIIDRSGSMSGERIEQAKAGAIEAVRRLGAGDIFSLVVFDHEVQTLIPAGPLEDREKVENIIRRIQPGGWTNIHAGMEAGLRELAQYAEGNYLHRAVLLSDGHANRGPTTPEAFAELGRQFGHKGIIVSTVGLGLGYNEHLLTSLSSAGEGNHYFVQHARDLPRIFGGEIGQLLATVARGVTIRIEIPEGIEVRRVLGRPYERQGSTMELNFHDLAAEQRKYTILEVAVPEGQEEAVRELLQASARYTAVHDGSAGEVRQNLTIRYTGDEEQARQAVDEQVQRDFITLARAQTQEEVLRRVEMNDREGARQQWQNLSVDVQYMGIAPSAVEELNEAINEEDAILRSRSYRREEVLMRRASSYQMMNQQVPVPDSDE